MVLTQAQALSITLLTEGAVAALLAPVFGAARLRAAACAIGGSLVTHPIVWFGVLAAYPALGGWAVLPFETFALAAEAAGYRWLATGSWRSAAWLSLAANFASYGLGFVLQHYA